MEVKFSKPFEKDFTAISTNKNLVLKVDELIQQFQKSDSLLKIEGIKRLKGHAHCYRIRIGHYRLGLLVEGKVVWLARLLHRKEIYRYFP
ncbi:MAG: type II toxin-antitoxin system RelE/ParE family toxin [Bacteroidetes bacterium]|nr:type II toxin-antitoxin system RelE/ParE family toxin [Bacteroidota bacterium]